jgi:methylmalonyl-CoA mutase N-terminal domain/subunit
VTLTAQQPDNNIVRVTLQALAAVLGGTQSLHTNSRDEALALPTEESVRIALRTQQILAYESGVASSVDPLGGSYLVEKLTDQLEHEAAAYIRTIDDLGGVVNAIEGGYIQREIEASAYKYSQSVESGDRVVVGVNRFVADEEPGLDLLRVDEAVQARQVESLRQVRARRDAAEVRRTLGAVEAAARGSDNLMPFILEAVRAYASIGEICNALRAVFGEYRESYT